MGFSFITDKEASLCFVFQLHAAISHQVDPECLGLGLGSVLLNSLKQTVVTLASNAGVLNTVQTAAQAVLQSGWSVLLPTAEERARALSALLPSAGMFCAWSRGWGRKMLPKPFCAPSYACVCVCWRSSQVRVLSMFSFRE